MCRLRDLKDGFEGFLWEIRGKCSIYAISKDDMLISESLHYSNQSVISFIADKVSI
jgi:hypothetical protein